MAEVTEKIKIASLMRKTTQKELAEKLGTTQANLSKKYKADNWRIKDLEEIARALDAKLELNFIIDDKKI